MSDLIREVVSLERGNVVVFCYLSGSEIWLDKRVSTVLCLTYCVGSNLV